MQVEGIPLYRARDVAAMVDVDVSTIYRAIRTGELNAYRVGKLLRIPASAIDAYLHKRPAASTTVVDQELAVESNFSHATRPV
ncbi:MAG: helix-turn-helix domain-containing protein [Actinobacteria bacterium]|nr:helix-turn-helix domain-containing protein [Actinomycetota bacterium]